MKKIFLIVGFFSVGLYLLPSQAMIGPEQLISGEFDSKEKGETPWWDEDQSAAQQNWDEPDPLEPLNRAIFGFNRLVDGILFKPAAIVYNETLPDFAKTGVSNFIDNLFSPVTFANNVLQAEGKQAAHTFFRFLVNSTIGILGLMDVAKEMGIPGEPATLNQTFAKWGIESGPYLMLPLYGPSSFRGTYGMAGDWFMNPWFYVAQNKYRRANHHHQQRNLLYSLYGLDLINRRAQLINALNDVEKNSLDPYAAIRSIYFQKQREMEQRVGNNSQKK